MKNMAGIGMKDMEKEEFQKAPKCLPTELRTVYTRAITCQ